MVATELASRQILGVNQRAYQCLKLSLSLNLRRQVLLAVCDNIVLQNQLSAQLEADMTAPEPLPDLPPLRLARLTLDPAQTDFVAQVAQWLQQPGAGADGLQVLGIEQMTRQTLMAQHHFLQSLNAIESLLPHLDTSLLLWLPWPWLRAIQQSAPQFWRWRSGLFEFVGEPTAAVPHRLGHDRPRTDFISVDLGQLASVAAGSLNGEADQLTPLGDSPADWDCPEKSLSSVVAVSNPETALDFSQFDQPFEQLAQQRQQLPPAELAQAYLALGHHYRRQVEAGAATPETLAQAIAAYEEGLRWLDEHDPAWGSGLNDLGTLCWLQAQQHPDLQQQRAGMLRSLEAYATGLAKIDQQQQPDVASRLHSNVGAVHSTLATREEPVVHLQQAIAAYRLALPLCADRQPEEYATLQNSLGSVYWKLSHYEPPQQARRCLHRAIIAYNEALRRRHPHETPLEYAAVQNNLGIAYWSLAKHERPVFLLKHAIAAYRDALNYRTPHTDPAACASTYNNLGTAYWDIATHLDATPDPQNRYRQNAVIAYEAALKAAQLAPSDLDLRSVHHCLGNVYDQMAHSEAGGYLPKAMAHYLAALAGLAQDAPLYEPIFQALVRNVRSHYDQLGLEGQQAALSQIPPEYLPEVMRAL